jgi:hypothetical protein
VSTPWYNRPENKHQAAVAALTKKYKEDLAALNAGALGSEAARHRSRAFVPPDGGERVGDVNPPRPPSYTHATIPGALAVREGERDSAGQFILGDRDNAGQFVDPEVPL